MLRSPPWLGWPLWNICVTNYHGYVPLVVSTSRSFPRSWLITGCLTTLTRRVSLVEQELFTLPEHLSSPPVFSGVRVSRSIVLYVCFIDRCLSFCTFSFGHCVVCSSSVYGVWLLFGIFKLLLISMFVFHLFRSKKWTHTLSVLRKLLKIWLGLMNTRSFFYRVASWWNPEKFTDPMS
jgi:multidrug transporter EmrE-like cation transporter